MINGLYGKLAQGLEHKTFLSLLGEQVTIKPSQISCSHYAAHVTGMIRTVIGGLINTIEGFQGCKVIHWTTDGLVFTMP